MAALVLVGSVHRGERDGTEPESASRPGDHVPASFPASDSEDRRGPATTLSPNFACMAGLSSPKHAQAHGRPLKRTAQALHPGDHGRNYSSGSSHMLNGKTKKRRIAHMDDSEDETSFVPNGPEMNGHSTPKSKSHKKKAYALDNIQEQRTQLPIFSGESCLAVCAPWLTQCQESRH